MKKFYILVIFLMCCCFSSTISAERGGDKITSYPIVLKSNNGKYFLSFYYKRNQKYDGYDCGMSDQWLVGMERRIYANGNTDSVVSIPDELRVDFIFADTKEPYKIINPKEEDWNCYPTPDGSTFTKGEPPFVVWGGGGKKYGYTVDNGDSALSVYKGIYPDIYDDGFDENFQYVYLPLPNEIFAGGRDSLLFRFRIRVNSLNNCPLKYVTIPDDDDVVFIDNVKLQHYYSESKSRDLVVENTFIDLPYTMIPKNQAKAIPIVTQFRNTSNKTLQNVRLTVQIRTWDTSDNWPGNWDNYYYEKYWSQIKPNQLITVNLPDLNLFNQSSFIRGIGGRYQIRQVITSFNGSVRSEEYIKTFNMFFGDVFVYEQYQNPRNDVSDQSFSGIPGKGLSLKAYSSGLYNPQFSYGDIGGSGPGELAMKFELKTTDTIYGYKCLFGFHKTLDDISFGLYTNGENGLPSTLIPNSFIFRQRGWDDVKDSMMFFEVLTYLLPKPIELQPGTYWISIGQLGLTGLELAGSKRNMFMATTNLSEEEPLGDKGMSLFVNKRFREFKDGKYQGNKNMFAYYNDNLIDSKWVSFSPTVGNPGYGHLDHYGTSKADSITKTYTRGTFIPMLRPYFGTSHIVTDVSENNLNTETLRLDFIAPNPAAENAQIGFTLGKPETVKIEITDLQGRTFISLNEEIYSAGSYAESINLSNLSSGIYFISIRTGMAAVSGRIAVVK